MSDFSLISTLQISNRLDRIEKKCDLMESSNRGPDIFGIIRTVSPIISSLIVVVGGTIIGYNLTATLEQRKVELGSIEEIIEINAKIQATIDPNEIESFARDLTLFGSDAVPSLLFLLGDNDGGRKRAAQLALTLYVLHDEDTQKTACNALTNLRDLISSSGEDAGSAEDPGMISRIEIETVDQIRSSNSCRL